MLNVKYGKNWLHGFRGDAVWKCWRRWRWMPAYTISSPMCRRWAKKEKEKTFVKVLLIHGGVNLGDWRKPHSISSNCFSVEIVVSRKKHEQLVLLWQNTKAGKQHSLAKTQWNYMVCSRSFWDWFLWYFLEFLYQLCINYHQLWRNIIIFSSVFRENRFPPPPKPVYGSNFSH